MKHNELGPEKVLSVYDPKLRFHGYVVVDNTRLGPAGGGTRMMPDLTDDEVADLARGMTFKFAIMGLPRGGSKAGIVADPQQAPERKKMVLRSFGNMIRPLIEKREVAIGPDMGVGVDDVQEIYRGAGLENPRSGLFQEVVDGDPAAFHFTGRGVATAAEAAASICGFAPEKTTVAIEGFGQVGVGTARYLSASGYTIVAVSTLSGMLHEPNGIDIERLISLRREHGDDCILEYPGAKSRPSEDIYFIDVDIMIPGARPYVINSENAKRLKCKIVCPAANIAVTSLGKIELHRERILYVPDYIANAGGALASWVDFLDGSFTQAIAAVQHRIGYVTREVVGLARKERMPPGIIAEQIVVKKLRDAPPERLSFEATKELIRNLLLNV